MKADNCRVRPADSGDRRGRARTSGSGQGTQAANRRRTPSRSRRCAGSRGRRAGLQPFSSGSRVVGSASHQCSVSSPTSTTRPATTSSPRAIWTVADRRVLAVSINAADWHSMRGKPHRSGATSVAPPQHRAAVCGGGLLVYPLAVRRSRTCVRTAGRTRSRRPCRHGIDGQSRWETPFMPSFLWNVRRFAIPLHRRLSRRRLGVAAEALGGQARLSGRRALILVCTPGDQCTTGSPSGTGRPAASIRLPSSRRTAARCSGHGSCSTVG